jgi:hypothetical protein
MMSVVRATDDDRRLRNGDDDRRLRNGDDDRRPRNGSDVCTYERVRC